MNSLNDHVQWAGQKQGSQSWDAECRIMSYDDVASAVNSLPSTNRPRESTAREEIALSVWLVQNYAAPLWKKTKSQSKSKRNSQTEAAKDYGYG